MKKAFITFTFFILVILGILGLLYIFIRVYDFYSEKKRVIVNYTLTRKEIEMMRDGDIILRHGYGFVSDLITETLSEKTNVSHCAIFVKNDTSMHVIHSVSQSLSDYDGVQMQDLKRFINDSKKNSVIVLRYKTQQNEDPSLISKNAHYYLDKKVPFDNNFDITDSTEFFCSELLWKVFLNAYNVDIFEDKYGMSNNEFLKFDVFTNPKYFEIVFSHHDSMN